MYTPEWGFWRTPWVYYSFLLQLVSTNHTRSGQNSKHDFFISHRLAVLRENIIEAKSNTPCCSILATQNMGARA